MKNLKGVITLLFIFWCIGGLFAQSDDTYIIHEVKKKETLYSLSRSYNVPIKSIIAVNKGVEEGLSIGQKVRIPKLLTNENTKDRIHIVKEKETFYSISKMYNVTVEDIKKWNKRSSNSLDVGEKLKIRNSGKKEGSSIDSSALIGKKVHIVKKKETLYAISRQYGVSTEDLMKWNKMSSNVLSVGQKLIVGEDVKKGNRKNNVSTNNKTVVNTTSDITTEKVNNKTEKTEEKEKKKTESIEVFEDDKPRRVKNISGFIEIVQTGLAELIDETTETRKFLALHSSAKVGTIMKVRNEMNNQMVIVRVIGRIPDTGDNNKILIKVSKAAYDRLGALDKRFRVEVSYMP
ncbi:MAG: LysM peptidoglycan-binding domain-containing protein [Cyclobacteriaceae bacterium]|nr:LysM peptidoglycan-binding domain-containing protein [Cyclobacteriaceae bacterium]